jgi:hypothetical protein
MGRIISRSYYFSDLRRACISMALHCIISTLYRPYVFLALNYYFELYNWVRHDQNRLLVCGPMKFLFTNFNNTANEKGKVTPVSKHHAMKMCGEI